MLDGVYVDADDHPVFVPAPALSDSDVQQIVQTTAHRVIRLCRKRGLLEDGQVDPLSDEAPLLAAIAAASIRGAVATGERAGQRLRRVLRDPAQGVRTAPLCFASRGFSLHAATRIDAGNLTSFEQLCRYVARPPLAAGRLQPIDDERLAFALKTPWSDGTTHLVLSPLELIEKLAALVPPPRLNLIRYHGVLAPSARDRSKIVPAHPSPTVQPADQQVPLSPQQRAHRLAWAVLLARVAIDVSQCPTCGGTVRLVAALTAPASVRTYLEAVGLPARPPPVAPPRASPQHELDALLEVAAA